MADTRPPPIIPEETDYSAQIHDYRVWIFGQDVTHWLTGPPSITLAGHGGVNNCSFTLSNPNNIFCWLLKELKDGEFNLAPGQYNENAKAVIWEYRKGVQRSGVFGSDAFGSQNPKNSFFNPPQVSNDPSAPSVAPSTQVVKNTQGATTVVNVQQVTGNLTDTGSTPLKDVFYPIHIGSCIFAKNDPIKIWRRWPYQEVDYWIPEFTGSLSADPTVDINHASDGVQTVSITAADIREQMGVMRVQTNSVPLNISTVVPEVLVTEGLFSDLVLSSADTKNNNMWFKHSLAPLSFPELIALLTFGYSELDVNKTTGTATGTAQPPTATPTPSQQGGDLPPPNNASPSQEPFAVVSNVAGATVRLLSGRSRIGRLEKGLFQVKYTEGKTLEQWHALTVLGRDRLANSMTPGAGIRGLLTTSEMEEHGKGVFPGGLYDPWYSQVHLLVPDKAESVSFDIFQKAIFEYDSSSSMYTREWSSRLSLLNEACDNIDYQFWVSADGDLIFEFPQYDFLPCDYGTMKPCFEVDSCLLDGYSENADASIPSVVSVTGGISWEVVQATVTDSQFIKGIAWSPALIHRYGVNEKTISKPHIYDRDQLENHARLELQKAISMANHMSVPFVYRPFLTPNRPFFVKSQLRIGTIMSVSSSIPNESEEPSQSVELSYVRKGSYEPQIAGGVRFQFITAGFSSPVPYHALYTQEALSISQVNAILSSSAKSSYLSRTSKLGSFDTSRVEFSADSLLEPDCVASRLPDPFSGGATNATHASSMPWDRKSGGVSAIPREGVGGIRSRDAFLTAMQEAADIANAAPVGSADYPVTVSDIWTQIYHETSQFALGSNANLTGIGNSGWEEYWNKDKKLKKQRFGIPTNDGLGMGQIDPATQPSVNRLRALAGQPQIQHPATYYSKDNRISEGDFARLKANEASLFSGADAMQGMMFFDTRSQLVSIALLIKKGKAEVGATVSKYYPQIEAERTTSTLTWGTTFKYQTAKDLCGGPDCEEQDLTDALVTSRIGVLGVKSVEWFLQGVCKMPITSSDWKAWYAKNKNERAFASLRVRSTRTNGKKVETTLSEEEFEKAVYRRVSIGCSNARDKARIRRNFEKDLKKLRIGEVSGVYSTSRSLV